MLAKNTPPTETTRVVAERVLVLAPHQDDELLGCGCLLHQLVSSGARVHVEFLSDGAGGLEGPEGSAEAAGQRYALRRREEALAVAEFCGWTVGFRDLPDGSLVDHLQEVVCTLREKLIKDTPDLVLVPSPFELTSDHTATFEALFEVLSPVRSEGQLEQVAASCRVMAYSVNHPGYPNVLVDVSDDLEWFEQAMGLYRSQLALHNYGAAGLGLRRFRTHSLDASVEAAEGFIELQLEDFTTRSLSSLVASIGPASAQVVQAPIDVSLIVRTYNRPTLLRQALESIAANSRRPKEVIVVNDGGADPKKQGVFESLPLTLREVNLSRNSGRAAAANAGLEAAEGEYIGFLDDDDLLFAEHLQVLGSAVAAAGVRVAYSDAAVATYELSHSPGEGEQVPGTDSGWVCVQRALPYSRDFDELRLLVDNYIPLNTLLVERSLAMEVRFDEQLETFEDWDYLLRLSEQHQFHHISRTTCEYRHFVGSGHHALGALADGSAAFLEAKAKVMAKHRQQLNSHLLARVVTELRHETVAKESEVADLRARWDSDRLARAEASRRAGELELRLRLAEDRYHREHGEVESLRKEDERLREEIHGEGRKIALLQLQIESKISEEARLRQELEAESEHLQRTYAEIERLMELIRTMEGTRAWRLHELLQRRKG